MLVATRADWKSDKSHIHARVPKRPGGIPPLLMNFADKQSVSRLFDALHARMRDGEGRSTAIVIELLVKMGYGGSRADAAQAIGRSGDEGLDGIIKEDRLGLDIIYVQAKRWAPTVGGPEIQKFAAPS